MALAVMAPTEMSPVCMAPPCPPSQPSALPNISHIIARSGTPLARSCPAGRCVVAIQSSFVRSYSIPTALASSPWLWWIVPGMIPSRNR
jgi:hypothetical protein